MPIMIFGDICPDNDYRRLFDTKEYGPFDKSIIKEIQNASLTIANLECPATENTMPIVKTGPNLRANPQDIKLFGRMGIDILSLANNHILDYGILGVEDTILNCRNNNIKTVGAGLNLEKARVPIMVETDEKKVGIISFAEAEFNLATDSAPGANHFDPYSSYELVKKLKSDSDYVIVLYHGGIEHYKYPSPLLQKKCRKFVDSGADLVLCQHSHCIGSEEKFMDGTILYGQGNSCFGFREKDVSWNEGILVMVDPKTREISRRLLIATADGVFLRSEKESRERIEQMREDSSILSDSSEIESRWIEFCKRQEDLDMPLLYGKNRVFTKLNRILHNRLVNIFYSRKKQMITMNLLRCEAHHEVIQTILEDKIFR